MSETVPAETPDILVVDDAPANLQLLGNMLRGSGFKVRPVTSGAQALQVARHQCPDLMLLDINMPEMNGFETCEQFKADERLRDVPVIFVSALNEPLDKVRAFGVGGVDYVTKPFQFEEVEARVRTHLELRRRRRELESSYARLRALEELRDNLVHMVVHDLRNQMQVVYTILEIVDTNEQGLSVRGREQVAVASETISSLFSLISSILDVSKMEAGALVPNRTRFDLAALVRETVAAFRSAKGGESLICETPAAPVAVDADAELIRRVVRNLVDNALGYASGAPGSVRVAVSPAAGSVRVTVKDDGPGIPVQHHQRIFEKFGQAELHSRGKRFTTGLGLTFCKMAVEAHGGSIGVESEVGLGSTFWFELALAQEPIAP